MNDKWLGETQAELAQGVRGQGSEGKSIMFLTQTEYLEIWLHTNNIHLIWRIKCCYMMICTTLRVMNG